MKYLFLSISLLALIIGTFFLLSKEGKEEKVEMMVEVPVTVTEEKVDEGKGQPTFAWTYTPFEESEIPQTEIRLTATYENGTSETKVVDSIEGGCNEYGEPDADVYPQSTMIICYYAGLGHYFKVVEEEGGYLVQRRVFEEASPEYTPPIEDFVTITQF